MPLNFRKQNTIVGFFSLVGGFFGLFTGFSALSAFEILYYFAVRPIVDIKKERSSKVYPFTVVKAKNNKFGTIFRYLKNFLNESSVHTFNHIGSSSKSFAEKIVWTFLFILAMTGSYFMILQVYRTLRKKEIFISLEGTATNIEKVKPKYLSG